MRTLYKFSGTGGAGAFTVDGSGANLPEEYAPWRFRREVSTDSTTFQGGTDRAALEEVKRKGFAVMIWKVDLGELGKPSASSKRG